jgi:amino acid adenylation domain-containing protein
MTAAPLRLVHDTLLASAAAAPTKVAVVVDGRRATFAELLDSALRLASALQACGVERGDRVAIYMENGWELVVSVYATLLSGGVLVVINPATKPDKLAYMLGDSEARVLVTESGAGRSFVPALAAAPSVHTTICVGAPPAGVPGAVAFDDLLARTAPLDQPAAVIPVDLAALIYTSGSTGSPKGVMLTHQNMVFAMASIAQYLRLDSSDRILNVLPLAFDYGLYQLLMSVYLGATLVLERSFAYPLPLLRRVAAEEVTVVPLVPTVCATVLALARQDPSLVLPSVRRVTNTAAALPTEYIAQLPGVFPNALIFAMYGLTECKRVSYLEPELIGARPTSVGRAIPGTEIYLRTADGEPVAPGDPGILHVRGPHVMLGYWKQPELTAHMLKPGRWPGERVLCTHDYFTLDAEGYLYFVGRTDDIIKSRGEKVSPVEVENVLHAIPGVREAAVVGVPDPALGEVVRAFVVTDEGATLTPQEVRRACLARLESVAVPRDVVFVRELPKTPTGKVRKRDLREMSEEPAERTG